MDNLVARFNDGKEVFKLEERQTETSRIIKVIKRFAEKYKLTEEQSSYNMEEMFAGYAEIIQVTPAHKLSDMLGQMEISFTTILGRRVDLTDLKCRIDQALEAFNETRSHEDFFKFKALFDQYKSLFNNQYRTIRRILAKLKIPKLASIGLDYRYILRTISKLISRNVDDEEAVSVKNSEPLKKKILTLESKYHETTIYRGNYLKLGSLLQ